MAYRLFYLPVLQAEKSVEELNAFLRSHRVMEVEKEWIADGFERAELLDIRWKGKARPLW